MTYLVCSTITDLPEPEVPSVGTTCSKCGTDCWRSKGSLDIDAEIVCTGCAFMLDEPGDWVVRPQEYMAAVLRMTENGEDVSRLDQVMDALGIKLRPLREDEK